MPGRVQPHFPYCGKRPEKVSIPWKTVRGRARRVVFGGVAVLALAIGIWQAALRMIPFPVEKLSRHPAGVVLTDRHGEPLRVRLGVGDLDCRPGYVPEDSHWITKAMVAAEDKRFWEHGGLDPTALLRAVGQNVWFGRRISGASTLSTQVIRLLEPRPRTLPTKFIEAFRAIQMERQLDKRHILAQYLDRAPFGGNIVGIEAAARRYYGKAAGDLSLAEAALLAGVPQSPSRGHPYRHWERAKRRQGYVLERMEACGYITAEERMAAWREPTRPRMAPYPFKAPHFCDWVGVPAQPSADSSVRTTLDSALQTLAEDTLARHLANSEVDSGAIVVLEVASGAVRALAGSPDYAARPAGQVNGALAPRAAGSTLKPFVYALALDSGFFTPASVLRDMPRHYSGYDPQNFSSDFRGVVSMREALVQSLNLPAIEVEHRVGQERFYAVLRRLGLSTITKSAAHYGLGLVLGNAEVRLLDLSNAYACLARGGNWMPLQFLDAGPTGRTGKSVSIFSEEAAWLISDMLGGDERAMDITGHAGDVRLPPMAWKTGTSAGLRDAWTVAWNPEYVVGIWVGNADGHSSPELVGRKMATPMAWDVFRNLYPNNSGPWFARPATVQARDVCAVSGFVPGAYCRHRDDDWSIAGVSRRELCPVHTGGADTAESDDMTAFFRGRASPQAPSGRASDTLRITSPARHSVYRLLPDADGLRQQISLRAASGASDETLHWFVDDRPIGSSDGERPVLWALEQGVHQIVCSSSGGRSDRVQISVE